MAGPCKLVDDAKHPLPRRVKDVCRNSSTFRSYLCARRAYRRLGHGGAPPLDWVLAYSEALTTTRQDSILVLLQERFGTVPPEVEARVRAATDSARLQTALRAVLRINSPAELPL